MRGSGRGARPVRLRRVKGQGVARQGPGIAFAAGPEVPGVQVEFGPRRHAGRAGRKPRPPDRGSGGRGPWCHHTPAPGGFAPGGGA